MKILNGLTLTSALSLSNGVGSSGQVLTSQGASAAPSWTTPTIGTVTSVNMTVPSILSVSGNPITSSGTFALSLLNQNANLIFAGPSTGSASTPVFRSLVLADLPTSGVVAGTYNSVTVDDRGRVTSGTNPTTLSGYGITDALDTSSTGQTKAGALGVQGILRVTSDPTLASFVNGAGATITNSASSLAVQNTNSMSFAGTSGSVNYGIYSSPRATNTGGGTSQTSVTAVQGTPVIDSTAANSYVGLVGVAGTATRGNPNDLSTNANIYVQGGRFAAQHGTSLPTTSSSNILNAVLANTGNYSGTATNQYGMLVSGGVGGFAANANTGTYAAIYLNPITIGGSTGIATVTNFYGIRLDAPTISTNGTITNRYGIYQNDASGANYFAGNVGINNSAPAYKLHIGETITTADAANLFGITTASGGVFSIGVNDRSAANPTWNLTTGTSESLSIVQGSNTRLFMDGAGRFVAGTSLLSLPSWGANNTYNANGYINIKGSGEQNITLQTTDSNNTVSKFFTGNTAWGLWNDGTAVKPFVVGGYQTEWMRITSDNSGANFGVGIGVSSPTDLLEVGGGIRRKMISNGSTATPATEIGLQYQYSTTANRAAINFHNAYNNNGSAWMSFATSDTSNNFAERMRIDGSGNVGIGTANPTGDGTALHIHGTTYASLHLTNNTSGTAISDGGDIVSDGNNFIIRNRESTGSLYFRVNNGGAEVAINPSGQILTTAGTAGAPAITSATNTDTGLYFPATDTIALSTTGTQAMKINADSSIVFGNNTTAFIGVSSPSPILASGMGTFPAILNSGITTNSLGGIFYQNSDDFTNNGATTNVIYGIYSNPKISNTGASGNAMQQAIGLAVNPVIASSGAGASAYINLMGAQLIATRGSSTDLSSNSSNILQAAFIQAGHAAGLSTAVVTSTATGVAIQTPNHTGTINTVTGILINQQTALASGGKGATTTTSYGINHIANVGSGVTTGYIETQYGFKSIVNLNSASSMGTYFGVHLSSKTGTGTLTNHWGMYQEDTTAKNYFGGNVGIGVTNPSTALQVVGTITGTTFSGTLSGGAFLLNPSLTRIDSSQEGGQLNFNRPSDNTMYWALDTYGTSTAPSFRLLETSSNRLQIDPGGVVLFNGSAGSSGQVLKSQGTTTAPIWSSVGSGTVTSVAMTVPSYYTVTGSPVTTSGTFALSVNNQNANTILAGPASGAATTPTFRSLGLADIPSLGSSYLNITGGTISGDLSISSRFSQGLGVTASGTYSAAFGSSTIADGLSSHAEGDSTGAASSYAHAEGRYTLASHGLLYSITAFNDTGKTLTLNSTAGLTVGDTIQVYRTNAAPLLGITISAVSGSIITLNTTQTINSSWAYLIEKRATQLYPLHVEGYNNIASGRASHAEGEITIASGDRGAHSEGYGTISSGGYGSHSEGYNTTASGAGSHAEGFNTVASLDYAHAEGETTTASGYFSHAEGSATVASGHRSHSEGSGSTASGFISHAQGNQTTASGDHSHSGGYGTIAQGLNQTVIGKYNIAQGTTNSLINTDNAFIIGNGVDTNTRSNAVSINWNGGATFAGTISAATPTASNHVALKSNVDDALAIAWLGL